MVKHPKNHWSPYTKALSITGAALNTEVLEEERRHDTEEDEIRYARENKEHRERSFLIGAIDRDEDL